MILTTSRGAIGDAFEVIGGFPRPRWDMIAAWVAAQGGGADLWREVAIAWVLRLREHLGDGYRTAESPGFLLLAPRDGPGWESILRLLEKTRASLAEVGLDSRSRDDPRKVVCLVLRGHETYLDFTSHYDPPEGEFGHSAGVFLREGYPHFVAMMGTTVEATLVHELTHACMAGRGLPLWVEEGLTQHVAQEVTGLRGLPAEPRRLLWLRAYWRRKGLHDFWYGKGFHRAGRAQAASYDLAVFLAGKLLERDRDLYRQFLLVARWEDCGDSALREVFYLSPGDLAAGFLGEGDWKPVPETGLEFAARGYFLQERGSYPGAVIDLRAALQKDPEYVEALTNLAWVLATCPHAGIRDGAEAVRLARRACELTGWSWEPGLDTLGAAFAEAGDFTSAVELAEKAVALAAPELRAECEARLDLYRAGRPYRKVPSSGPDGSGADERA